MDYKTLDDLNKLIEKELKKMVDKGDLSASELQAAKESVCLMEKIIGLEEGTYKMGEYSYERGRSPRTGRYVSRDARYYDFDRGYSGHSIGDRAVEKLESMMDNAGSDYEREVLEKYIRMIRADER